MWHSRYSDQDRGWAIRVRFPVGEIGIFLLWIVHTDSAPSIFCSLNIRVKKSERETSCYPVCRVKVKDEQKFLKIYLSQKTSLSSVPAVVPSVQTYTAGSTRVVVVLLVGAHCRSRWRCTHTQFCSCRIPQKRIFVHKPWLQKLRHTIYC